MPSRTPSTRSPPRRVIIMGAAGRDFHNFLAFFRDDPAYRVECFTAAQIPGIDRKVFPRELSGRLYPRGIPIRSEEDLPYLVKRYKIDMVILAYSDLSHMDVMHKASLVNSLGPDFVLMGPGSTMLKSSKPVIAVTAVRTGCGKSQTTRKIASIVKSLGKSVAVVRHPMPYGNLSMQACQRYQTLADLDANKCTLEEREEYEPLIEATDIVYAGVDYRAILRQAEREADVIIWDGGNNDTPFFRPDLHITITDPHRPGHESSYHPGETNLRMADVVVINKERTAKPGNVRMVRENVRHHNPKALVVDAGSAITVDQPSLVRNRRVLVVEDGPTLTHGGMPYGAGTIAALQLKARIVDPAPNAAGSIRQVFRKFPHLHRVLPAMGYSPKQLRELERTINKTKCDTVIFGTPTDLRRVMSIDKPAVRVRYELEELSRPDLASIIGKFLMTRRTKSRK